MRAVRKIVRAAELGDVELGLTFVHDLEMRALNRAWRKKDEPTDVLSFAAQEGEALTGAENIFSYAASKHGVTGLMTSLARELGQCNIRVNSARAHAIYWSTPQSLWYTAESRRILALAEQSFVPAPSGG